MSTDDTREALGGPNGVHVREAIVIERPAAEVYAYWRGLENLPRVMSHLESVTDQGGGRSHWIAKGPAGVRVEWDAEIINDIEPELIAWRSLPGSDVVSAGSVHFEATGSDGTELVVTLQYAPPAGRAGALVAKLFGREPSRTIHDDLRQFKQALEDGQLAGLSASGETVTER